MSCTNNKRIPMTLATTTTTTKEKKTLCHHHLYCCCCPSPVLSLLRLSNDAGLEPFRTGLFLRLIAAAAVVVVGIVVVTFFLLCRRPGSPLFFQFAASWVLRSILCTTTAAPVRKTGQARAKKLCVSMCSGSTQRIFSAQRCSPKSRHLV